MRNAVVTFVVLNCWRDWWKYSNIAAPAFGQRVLSQTRPLSRHWLQHSRARCRSFGL